MSIQVASRRPEVYRPKGDAPPFDQPGPIGRIIERMRPDEGWVSLPLVLLLVGAMAWSISDARWILGRDDLTAFLIWAALAAAFWGYLSARLDLSPWLAHALGCTIGAFVLIEMIGASLPDATPGLGGWFHATAYSVTQAYLDLTWRHQISTLQVGHFCLILGVVVWGTAQAASYDVFGYHRSVNGVLLLAVVLIANMSLTRNDQFVGIVIFSGPALILLLLAHAADERSSWSRHRIWRGRDFEAPHLQGGVAFAAAAVLGSLILTSVASSAPLGGTFDNLSYNVQNALSWMGGYLPNGGASRIQANSDFGPQVNITSVFSESSHQVFTVRVESDSSGYHWRLVAYDTFKTTAWTVGSTHQDYVLAGGQLDANTLDQVAATTPGRTQVSISVHVQDSSLKHVIVANEPDSVNASTQRTLIGSADSADVAWLNVDASDYIVSAYVPNLDPSGTGLTEYLLSHAGTKYPPGLLSRYTQGADLVGSYGKALLSDIGTWARANGNTFDNEYVVAKAIQDYLRSSRFTYNADISGLIADCANLSTVDCFAHVRQGFCEQYATTMTMLMRMDGYPARYVQGYLPGPVDQYSRAEQVTSQQKHAWVEAYFPGYGWIPFDPTGGGVGRPTSLVPGSAVSPTPTPSATPAADGSDSAARPSRSSAPAGSGSTATAYGPTALLVSGVLALVLVLALFVLWRRRPKRPDEPQTVYRSVVRLASRLGYRPRPTQTMFEYTAMLSEVVPQARSSLGTVATAAVEVTYGRQQLSSERLAFVATAHRAIRRAFLRLMLRLPGTGVRSKKRP
jgi:hypothetical protein